MTGADFKASDCSTYNVCTRTFKDMPVLDAGILAAAEAVEHYEIARYGTLKSGPRSSA